MELKNTAGVYLDCSDGDVFVFFDDRPKSNIIKDRDYEKSIKGKIADISKVFGKTYLVSVKIINENKTSRVAWCVGDSD